MSDNNLGNTNKPKNEKTKKRGNIIPKAEKNKTKKTGSYIGQSGQQIRTTTKVRVCIYIYMYVCPCVCVRAREYVCVRETET